MKDSNMLTGRLSSSASTTKWLCVAAEVLACKRWKAMGCFTAVETTQTTCQMAQKTSIRLLYLQRTGCNWGHAWLTYQDSGNDVLSDNSQDNSKGEGPNEPYEVHDIGCPGIDLPNDCHTCTPECHDSKQGCDTSRAPSQDPSSITLSSKGLRGFSVRGHSAFGVPSVWMIFSN